jgi:hypothetical protein
MRHFLVVKDPPACRYRGVVMHGDLPNETVSLVESLEYSAMSN